MKFSPKIQKDKALFSGISCQTKFNRGCVTPNNSWTGYVSGGCSRCSPDRRRSKKNLKLCDKPKKFMSVLTGNLRLSRNESTSKTIACNFKHYPDSRHDFYTERRNQGMSKDLVCLSAPNACPLLKLQIKTMSRAADFTTKTGLVAHTPPLGRASVPGSTLVNRNPSTSSRRVASRSVTGPRATRYHSSGTSSSLISRIPTATRREYNISVRNDKARLSTDSRREVRGGDHIPRDDAAVKRLRSHFHEKCLHYEKLKKELNEKQKLLLELYNDMVLTQKEMGFLGQSLNLPTQGQIIDPSQIVECTKIRTDEIISSQKDANTNSKVKFVEDYENMITKLPIDTNKMNKLSEGLVSTCEQTLGKRKEIIDWLNNLVNDGIKGIRMHSLISKVNEYLQENRILAINLEKAKADFHKGVKDIIGTLNKSGLTDTVGLQLRIEQQTYEISEQQAQITNMKKKLQMEHLRSNPTRVKIEELEKELKEDKCKRMILQDRLARAENQAKNLPHIENLLEQAKQSNWDLERTVEKLNEENQQLQKEFDNELAKLTESITQNTASLEEISEARDKLQAEKEELEKKLDEVSSNYKSNIKTLKIELSASIAKAIEVEKKYVSELEEKKSMEFKLESLLNQLLDAQKKLKDMNTKLEERENDKKKYNHMQSELSSTREEFLNLQDKMKEYKETIHKQDLAIDEMTKHLREFEFREECLKNDLSYKDEYIQELKKKQSQLERQIHESELKRTSYEQQLDSLRNNLTQLRDVFGNFESVKEVRDMMDNQREQVMETKLKNAELVKALQEKDYEIVQQQETVEKQELLLQQKEEKINRLSAKEQELCNKINSLVRALEDKANIDTELNQKLIENKTEIEYLETELSTKSQQIAQFKSIMQTFEEQVREANKQKRIEEDKISELEKKIAEYDFMESQRKINAPGDNIDNLIKLLEDELRVPIEDPSKQLIGNKSDCKSFRKNNIGDYLCKSVGSDNRANYEPVSSRPSQEQSTRLGLSNYGKKSYNILGQDDPKPEKLDRKKAITHIDSQKWTPENLMSLHNYEMQSPTKVLGSNMSNFDKKKYNKMLKLAGHRM